MYDILRTQPEIVRLAKGAYQKQLDTSRYPFIGEEPSTSRNAKKAQWARDQDSEGRLIMFVAGGISHYEICAIQNLEKDQ